MTHRQNKRPRPNPDQAHIENAAQPDQLIDVVETADLELRSAGATRDIHIAGPCCGSWRPRPSVRTTAFRPYYRVPTGNL